MKFYKTKATAVTSAVYAVIVAVFLMVAYIATDGGIGWNFFTAIMIAILSVPIYILAISIIHYISNSQRLKSESKTLNNKFEKVLNMTSLCLAVISVFLLATLSVPIFYHVRKDWISSFCINLAPIALIFTCIGNVAILLNRPIARFIVWLVRKRNDRITIESKCIFITRICLLVFEIAAYPLFSVLATLFELWW